MRAPYNCDRVIVLHEGRVAGEVPGAEATEERLIELAMGGAAMSPLDPDYSRA